MINSNGLRFAHDPAFLEAVARFRHRLEVYLQFDGFTPAASAHLRGEERGPQRGHRVSLDAAVTVQPAEPPLNGTEPGPPESGQRELFHQADDLADVLGGHEVFQCLFGAPVVQAPAGRAAPQHRQQTGLEPFQFGQ